ncbi:hypothetical protein MLD38_038923 [Melastoma candidum]|uniref:Uncharacterized protein n=1 Tax=Melastoma candidum TaxID=119954 RepID=A0ACB9L151_9MYRT|nr:hypothetical protein MLD38_038923 [Melastoma candidum]
MRLFPRSVPSSSEKRETGNKVQLHLNVYDLTPVNNYLYWFGLGIFHSGIEAHGLEYGFGAHEYSTSGVFEVNPRSCPGFIFRRSVALGTTTLSGSEFRMFMEDLAGKYHGNTYHLISKNCNHFTNEVSIQLTGRPIPGWVNRLARLGSLFNCVLPSSIQVSALTNPPVNPEICDDDSDSALSTLTADSELEEVDHHLLTGPSLNVAYVKENW